jgi:hypothetical protein
MDWGGWAQDGPAPLLIHLFIFRHHQAPSLSQCGGSDVCIYHACVQVQDMQRERAREGAPPLNEQVRPARPG